MSEADRSPLPPAETPAAPQSGGHVRCYCSRCRMRGLVAPVMIITAGFLFLVDQFVPGIRFGQLWPVFIIVLGVLMLLQSSASAEGHRG